MGARARGAGWVWERTGEPRHNIECNHRGGTRVGQGGPTAAKTWRGFITTCTIASRHGQGEMYAPGRRWHRRVTRGPSLTTPPHLVVAPPPGIHHGQGGDKTAHFGR
jgi:hypothetical protein